MFEKIIDQQPSLKEYFMDFPKRLMELAYQEKIAKFSKGDVVIDMNLLREHLLSPDSIFEIDSLEDFIESLFILGFERSTYPEVDHKNLHLCYRFTNPKFVSGEPVSEDLYKTSNDPRTRFNKKLRGNGSLRLLQKIMRKKTAMELVLSRQEFARLKFNFALNEAVEKSLIPEVIEFNMEEPEYAGNSEILGYYGYVSTEALTQGFQDLLPKIKQPETDDDATLSDHPQEPTPQISNEIEVHTGEPLKKKRKYTKKSREENKETEQALLFLHKANVEMMEN